MAFLKYVPQRELSVEYVHSNGIYADILFQRYCYMYMYMHSYLKRAKDTSVLHGHTYMYM